MWSFRPYVLQQETVTVSSIPFVPDYVSVSDDSVKLPKSSPMPDGHVAFDKIDVAETRHGSGRMMNKKQESGRMRSVIIGINYIGQQGELRGCINDAIRVKNWLPYNDFPNDKNCHQQHVLTDEPEGSYANDDWVFHAQPTKEQIMKSLAWLVDGAKSGDSLFFHFSGHGVRVPDTSGDEESGYDESIVPLDYRTTGVILDDTLNAILVKDLPHGVRLTAIMDCCHSGSALDLPYTFEARTEDDTKKAKTGDANFQRDRTLSNRYATQEQASATKKSTKNSKMFKTKQEICDDCDDEEEKELMSRALNVEPQTRSRGLPGFEEPAADDEDPKGLVVCKGGEVVKFSGCMDEQTSADVSSTKDFDLPDALGPDAGGGACTSALLSISSDNYAEQSKMSYVDILEEMRVFLKSKGFKQIPQLSSTIAFDLHSNFDLTSVP